MRNIDIQVFRIAKTEVDREEVKRWMEYLGANDYDIPSEEAATDPALLVALAAKRCYLSFEPGLNPNVNKVRTDMLAYLDNILRSGHGSVLEHSVYTFAIEGVSRVFTGEMNRHRAGVGISEGSMRYIRYTDIPWWMPPSIKLTDEEQAALDIGKSVFKLDFQATPDDAKHVWVNPNVLARLDEPVRSHWVTATKKLKTAWIFNSHYTTTEENYAKLQEIWRDELAPGSKFHGKKQITSMMRRIIPMGVASGGVWTMNMRAVRHIIAMRASEAAEEEIAYVFGKIAQFMVKNEPMLVGDFTQDENGFWAPKYPKV